MYLKFLFQKLFSFYEDQYVNSVTLGDGVEIVAKLKRKISIPSNSKTGKLEELQYIKVLTNAGWIEG